MVVYCCICPQRKTATPLCQLCSRTARAVAKGMVAAHSQTSRLWLSHSLFPLWIYWWLQQLTSKNYEEIGRTLPFPRMTRWKRIWQYLPILMQLLQSTITVSMLKTSDTAWSADAESIITRVGLARPFWGQGHYPEKAPTAVFQFLLDHQNCSLKHKTQRLKVTTQNTMQKKQFDNMQQHKKAVKIIYSWFSHHFPIFPFIFPSFSHDFPIIFLPFSHDFPIIQLPSSGRLKATAARVVKSPRIKASTAWFGLFRSPKATVGENYYFGDNLDISWIFDGYYIYLYIMDGLYLIIHIVIIPHFMDYISITKWIVLI